MHIVHLYKDYAPVHGGIEAHLQTLAEGMAARGVRTSVVVCQPAEQQLAPQSMHHGVTIYRVPRQLDIASSPISLALWPLLRRLKPDLIHLQMPWPTGDIMSLAVPQIPLVVSYQSDVVRQQGWLRLYAPVLRHTLRRAARIVVSSDAYRDSSPWLAPFHAKCRTIPLGIEPAVAADPALIAHWQHRLPFPCLLWVGRMRYYKGLEYAVAALALLPSEVRLVLVGDGPERERLGAYARAIGVSERIIWLGSCSRADVSALYSVAQLFVFPSHVRAEAYGLAMLEALAAGLPAVSCEIGTATSVINRHQETGLVVPPGDAVALAEAIMRLLADRTLRTQYAHNATTWVQRQYTVTPMIDAMLALYGELGVV